MTSTTAVLIDRPTAGATAASRDSVAALKAELAELEPVVGAALLATTAFRLRDEPGLVVALRALGAAVDALERARRDD